MKRLFCLFFFFSLITSAQTDFSSDWEDFFSYNNVKDIVKEDNIVYALTDNAVFTYNIVTNELNKVSSVQGLSGEVTSAIYYNKTFSRLIIGYENGLIEVIDANGVITSSPDIINFNQAGSKRINAITEHNNILFLSTPFGIVGYDIEKLEFADTYFIGANSSAIIVNDIAVNDNTIYAATENGLFTADINSTNLIDFNAWALLFPGNNISYIESFGSEIYVTINSGLYSVNGSNLVLENNFSSNIINLKSSDEHLSLTFSNEGLVLDDQLTQVGQFANNSNFTFSLQSLFADTDSTILATKEFGLLISDLTNSSSYLEVHPDGPLTNDVFSLAAQNNNLWVVYGGYDATFTPIGIRQGISNYDGTTWNNFPYNPSLSVTDLVDVTIDPENDKRVFISSFGDTRNLNSLATGGLLEFEDTNPVVFYNHLNSPLQDIVFNDPSRVTIRIGSTVFDRNGNLWVNNIGVENRLKKLSPNGQWSNFNINGIITNSALGLGEMAIDRSNTVWIATRRNGVLAFNENGNRQKALLTNATQGSLPNARVQTIAVDANNRLWIGTLSGLVVYTNTSGFFDASIYDAEPIIILDDGIPKRLLGDQTINAIAVDGADNKWFGTDNGGVLYTNPNGQNTLGNFNKSNSPLPSNKILKIAVDKSNGKVYFATDKGIVAYNSNVAPFGNTLQDVYAYPNPVLKNHDFVTIDGRNGNHLPKGTNVKIVDVAGNLVYETNVVEGQELQGGKVVWNKTNLAGKKVASGVYIVLLSNEDASETTTAKIAIVN